MKKFFVLLTIFLAAALSACGGQGSASTSLTVAMTDFHFTPDSFTIPAGAEITLNVTNNGAVAHQFAIFKFGAKPGGSFTSEDEKNVYWQALLQPGDAKTVTFTAPAEPGEYFLACGIPGHLEAGMSGKIIVVAK